MELLSYYREKIENSERCMNYCIQKWEETTDREWLEDAVDWKNNTEAWLDMAREEQVYIV